MPSFWNRRIKTKKNSFVIERLAYSFLYLFSIAIFYLIWNAYTKTDLVGIQLYIMVYLIYIILFILIIKDLYNNYEFFKMTKNVKGTKLLEETHFLCANPMCSRCGSWYWGLALSLAITISLNNLIIPILRNYNFSPYYLIIFGGIIFLVTTPMHGALNFINRIESSNEVNNNKSKIVFGLISGLSLSLIVIGILMLLY